MLTFKAKHILLCLILLVTLLIGCSPSPPPNDDTLLETFRNHRSDFETLANMLIEDTDLQMVARGYTRPDNVYELGISGQRILDYRELLRKLDLLSIQRHQEGISLTAYAGGALPDDGIYKGYVYFPDGLPARLRSSLVDNLDNLGWNPDHTTSLYRQIDDNWYLWFFA